MLIKKGNSIASCRDFAEIVYLVYQESKLEKTVSNNAVLNLFKKTPENCSSSRLTNDAKIAKLYIYFFIDFHFLEECFLFKLTCKM